MFYIFARSNSQFKMKELKEFDIPFIGLKEGNHTFEFEIDNKFFDLFQFDDFNSANIKAIVDFTKKNNLLNLNFDIKGSVNVPCDVTNEDFDLDIEGNLPLIVKFGHEYNDDSDEILILPNEAHQINVAQYIYELIVLSVPTKKVHPQVIDGTMESETLDKLEELTITENKTVAKDDATDPRWDKLKDLLTGKKT